MFTPSQTSALLALLQTQPVAALGTLHKGEPFVSMVPYALVPGTGAFVIHVSSLASHTRDMSVSPAVSLLICAIPSPEGSPQSLARATFQCQARRCDQDDIPYEACRRSYLARFPQSEDMFGFGDFSLFTLTPRTLRFVGGFAQAASVVAPELGAILARAAESAS